MEYTNTHTEAAANLHFAERAAAQQRGDLETASHCHNHKFLHNVEALDKGANLAERAHLKKLQRLVTSNSLDNDTAFYFLCVWWPRVGSHTREVTQNPSGLQCEASLRR